MTVALPQAASVKTLRCSTLDSLFSCTPSVLADGPNIVRVSSNNDGQVIGKIIHDLAEGYVKNGAFNIKNAVVAAGLAESNEEEVAKLMIYLIKAWEELKEYFPNPMTESIVKSDVLDVNGEQFMVQGTCDVLSPLGTENAIFADYKSGFLDDSYHQQMAGYAYAIWCVMGRPANTTITGVVIFLRHRYYRIVKFDAARLQQWEYDLTHNVIPSLAKYKPGKTCRYCDLYATCAARTAVVHGTLNAMMTPKSLDPNDPYLQFLETAKQLLSGLNPAAKNDPIVASTVSDLLFKMKLAQQAIEDVHALIRQAVQSVGGIPLGNGYELAIRNVTIDSLIPAKAMQVLRAHVSDAQIMDAMRLSLPKILTAYSASFSRGEKAKARNTLEHALAEAGAISTSTQERLEEMEVSLPEGVKNVPTGVSNSQPESADRQ